MGQHLSTGVGSEFHLRHKGPGRNPQGRDDMKCGDGTPLGLEELLNDVGDKDLLMNEEVRLRIEAN